jgi:GR25 family glycosyltransferase involved in LPS biosynthesis
MFPIYIIGNEAREPEQCKYLQNYFKQLGLSVTYFQPTYMDTLTVSELSRFSEKTHGRHFKPAEKSIFLNYLYLFEKCVKEHTGYVLILECDVIFEGDLLYYLQNLESFIKKNAPHMVSIGSGCDLIDDDVNTDDMSLQIAKKQVIRCTDTLLFSYEGIQMILEYIHKFDVFDEPIDTFLEIFIKNNMNTFHYYWVWPSITLQGSQYGYYKSTIQS